MSGSDAIGAGVVRRAEPHAGPAPQPYKMVAIGPHPPFMTGQSVATQALLRRLERSGVQLRVVDTSPRNLNAKWTRRLSRIPRCVRALLALAAGRKAPWVYIVVDADAGGYPNILCAALARLRGSRVIAHHHNYSYITQPARRMKLFCKAAGPDAVQITLCELMSRELRERYGGVRHTLKLYDGPLHGSAKDRFYNDIRVEELGRRHDRVTTTRLRRISQAAR